MLRTQLTGESEADDDGRPEFPGVTRCRSSFHHALPSKSKSSFQIAYQSSFACLVEGANVSEMAHIDGLAEEFDGALGGAQAHVLRMEPNEEYANALSMLAPLLACACYVLLHPQASINVWICVVGQFLHMPFSMMYHVQMARLQKQVHPVDNPWRVLDQTFILLVAAMWAVALAGVLWYGLVVACLSLLYIYWLWKDLSDVRNGRPADPSKGGAPGRRHSLLMMVLIYLVPPLLHGDWVDTLVAYCFFAASASIFVTYPFGGYSHAVFHLVLAPYQWFVLCAADSVHEVDTGMPLLDAQNLELAAVLLVCVIVRHGLARY
mmetsp:Transcript_73593/g.204510  ORF Transcript_73593/g.204510 Transcript_73593/m.204510 type:complete len:321 (-) Transcript_73593:96-1058(-)